MKRRSAFRRGSAPIQESREDVIERSIAHFSAADKDYGQRVAAAAAAARKRAAR